jgi:hypothetical protein
MIMEQTNHNDFRVMEKGIYIHNVVVAYNI